MANNLIYSPADVAKLGYDYIKYRHEHKEFAVDFPVTSMRSRVYPLAAGEVMSIIARPGNMKTGLMMAWARQRARIIKPYENRVVVYATWEQSIEELHSFYVAAEQKVSVTKMAMGDLSKEDFDRVLTASGKRVSEPLFFVGHSVMRKSGRQPINADAFADAIDAIQKDGFIVDSVFADYLQRMAPVNTSDPQTVAYSKTMDALKNIALGFGVPLVVGVQASREVEQLELPLPEMHHAQWTSNIEQSSDRVISLVRPRRYREEGQQFGSRIVKGISQLVVSVLKQKLGEGNFVEWTSINPLYNTLNDNEQEVEE